MNRRSLLAGLGASSIGLFAGCLGDDNREDESTSDPRPNFFTDEHPQLGEIIVDSDGYVVYMFDSDEQWADESACYDNCVDEWPPLLLDEEPIGDQSVAAEMTLFERENGSMQVAVNGWPIYYFSGDEDTGQANGQGVNEVWWVLRPGGNPPGERAPTMGTEPGTKRTGTRWISMCALSNLTIGRYESKGYIHHLFF